MPGRIEPHAGAMCGSQKTRKPTIPAPMAMRRLIKRVAPEVAVPGIEPGRVLPRWILSPLRLPVPPDGLGGRVLSAPARRGKVRDRAGEDFRREPDALAEGGGRMDGAADVLRVGAHLDGEADLGDQVAGVDPDDRAPEDAAGRLVEEQLDESVLAPVRDRAPGRRPGKDGLPVLDAALLELVLGRPGPGDLRIGVRD